MNARDFLYLGRGVNYPIALEGALKLKEISYIHAEGYPAGEMKHGPIALIDEEMPVVVLAPKGKTYERFLATSRRCAPAGGKSSPWPIRAARKLPPRPAMFSGFRKAITCLCRSCSTSPPAPGLQYRRSKRDGCGSAAKPGQERDGGIGESERERGKNVKRSLRALRADALKIFREAVRPWIRRRSFPSIFPKGRFSGLARKNIPCPRWSEFSLLEPARRRPPWLPIWSEF